MQGIRNQTYVRPSNQELRDNPPTRIVAAAILKGDKIWTGKRHAQLIYGPIQEDLAETLEKKVYVTQDEQGFLADNGMFVSRMQALAIAIKAEQIPRDFDRVLLSDHLW